MIGAAKHIDKELEVLHRSVRVINDELMEIEADQKHVPRWLEDLGLIQGNIVKTPRVKLSATESNAIENSSILEGEQATLFWSGTMRCACLAQHRPDISEAIKCLARGMSKPRTGHMVQLKRVARYLARSTKESTTVPCTRKEQSTFGSTSGQRLGRRHCNASKHDWSDRETWTTFAQTQLNGTKRDRACLQAGTWNYSSRCIQILRVQKQLLLEEELARALVTYRQGCYGCKNA